MLYVIAIQRFIGGGGGGGGGGGHSPWKRDHYIILQG